MVSAANVEDDNSKANNSITMLRYNMEILCVD
jgi:hypothetical protein